MGTKEIPLQHDLFTGELVDTRTSSQKKQEQENNLPQQLSMFSSRDIAQFGVNAHPLLPLADTTRLALIQQDPRTPEEQDRDLERAAQEKTIQLFPPKRPNPGVYLVSQSVPLLPAPTTLLLSAKSVVPDREPQQNLEREFQYELARLERKCKEQQLYLRLLHS